MANDRKVVAGIDIGSGHTKCVLMDEKANVAGKEIVKTRPNFEETAQEALDGALKNAGCGKNALQYVATTGLGRYSIPFRNIQITDITCTARAVHFRYPDARFVLDVGAQSTRAIRTDERGKVKDFRMNEKCAAGSGGFLERAAKYLEISLPDIGALSARATQPQSISSICAVLAESEIINHVSEGKQVADILRGVHQSLAERALMLLKRVGVDGPVVLVGGVALQEGMRLACHDIWKNEVTVPEDPRFMAATGAALLGWQRLRKHDASHSKMSA